MLQTQNRDGPCKVRQSEDSSYHPRATWLTSWAELARACSRHPIPVGAGPPTSPSSTARINESTRPTATLASPGHSRRGRCRFVTYGVLWPCILPLASAQTMALITPSRGSGVEGSVWPGHHTKPACSSSSSSGSTTVSSSCSSVTPHGSRSSAASRDDHSNAPEVLCWPSHSMMTERAHLPIFKSTIHHCLRREGSRAFSAPHSWDVMRLISAPLVTAQYTEYSQTKGLEYSKQSTWLGSHWGTGTALFPVSFILEDWRTALT